jgi:biopolymer transport protein ExbD
LAWLALAWLGLPSWAPAAVAAPGGFQLPDPGIRRYRSRRKESYMQLGGASRLVAGGNTVKAEINVAPLVDVCLVLLIIFMVVTPILGKGVPVQLPETTNPEKMPEGPRQLDIAIQQDDTVSVGSTKVSEDQILAVLQGIHEAHPDRTVVIEGDRRVDYARVRQVMKLVNQAGFSGVGLVFHRRAQPG